MRLRALRLDMLSSARTPGRVAGVVILLAGLGASVWMADRQSEVGAELERERSRGEEIGRAARPDRAVVRAVDPETERQLKRARGVLEQLSARWDELFAMVEAAGFGKLALLTLVPDVKGQSLRITGEAPSLDDVLRYLERLAGQPGLAQVHLISYESGKRDGNNFVQFAISARWSRS